MCLTSTMKTCTKGLLIKVKEVDLPKFLGEGKAGYEPWMSVFMFTAD